jgi:hypothetical protein
VWSQLFIQPRVCVRSQAGPSGISIAPAFLTAAAVPPVGRLVATRAEVTKEDYRLAHYRDNEGHDRMADLSIPALY